MRYFLQIACSLCSTHPNYFIHFSHLLYSSKHLACQVDFPLQQSQSTLQAQLSVEWFIRSHAMWQSSSAQADENHRQVLCLLNFDRVIFHPVDTFRLQISARNFK
jgi:hypothetical protein